MSILAAPAPAKWGRRAITVPGVFVLWLLDLAALPVLLLAGFVADLVGRRSFAAVRFHLAIAVALTLHVAGLFVLFGAWLAGVARGPRRERELDVEGEAWFATTAWRAAVRLFGMHVTVEGNELLDERGPVVVMSRHASLLDVLLPVVFVCAPGCVGDMVALSEHSHNRQAYVRVVEMTTTPCRS